MFGLSSLFYSLGNFLAINIFNKSGYISIWVVFLLCQFFGIFLALSSGYVLFLFALSLFIIRMFHGYFLYLIDITNYSLFDPFVGS